MSDPVVDPAKAVEKVVETAKGASALGIVLGIGAGLLVGGIIVGSVVLLSRSEKVQQLLHPTKKQAATVVDFPKKEKEAAA